MLAGPRSSSYRGSSANAEKSSKFNEFKYLYFNIQKAINAKVILSLKYELLKSPEIHAQITKPLTQSIIELSNQSGLNRRFSTTAYGSSGAGNGNTIPQSVVFILLLLRYEYIIQSENNLICFDFLTTKANICEILAIRMLREYKSNDRINLLFIKPMGDQFNTLELSILTKSKKFLSQPVLTQIMDKIYNGDITIVVDSNKRENRHGRIFSGSVSGRNGSEQYDEESSFLATSTPSSIINYKYQKISINMIRLRSESVPRYQSLVINIKLVVFSIFYFMLILKHKHHVATTWVINLIELLFWCISLNYNFEVLVKLRHIRFKFLRKIIWTYIDMILIGLLDLAMIFRLHNIWSNGSGSSFHNLFSIISIILLPRILSIFNNYEFFNMIILSCKRMVWKMIGLFCLLISLTSGFYISFISLTVVETKTSSDILFDMLKVFFGFTPAVWNSWDEYNTLGKFTQMGYLFLVQFVISTILAIILSEVFHKIAASNKEEFHYFKATNIIIYQQTSKIMRSTTTIVPLVSNIMDIFKIPIIIGIFLYEVIISKFYYRENENQESVKDLKYFTFFDKDKDYPTDSNTKENGGIIFNSPFVVTPRKFSSFDAGNNLKPVQSISTLGNFKSASTDSLFIDDLLNRRYGGGLDTGDTLKMSRIRSRTHKDPRKDNEIIQKLNQIECLFSEVVNKDVSSKLAPELSNVNDPAVFIGLDNIYKIRETSPLSDAQLVTSIESLSDENDEDP